VTVVCCHHPVDGNNSEYRILYSLERDVMASI